MGKCRDPTGRPRKAQIFSLHASKVRVVLQRQGILQSGCASVSEPAPQPNSQPIPGTPSVGVFTGGGRSDSLSVTRNGVKFHGVGRLRSGSNTMPSTPISSQSSAPDPHPLRDEVDFCCGEKRAFSPHPLYCPCCAAVIGPYKNYRLTKGTICGIKHFICEKCFTGAGNSSRTIYISESISLKKTEFTRVKNDKAIEEPITFCAGCGSKFHSVCVVHIHNICPEYLCYSCRQLGNIPPISYRAANLPETRLCAYIEGKVASFLHQHEIANKVWIRTISSEGASVPLGSNITKRYALSANSYPYRNKLIFAFEEIDGVDVAFFAFIVQEYYSDCPPPNRGRINLSYLDSVSLFQPPHLRTSIYHRILLSYFSYAKSLGFEYIHIWACPPGPTTGGNYIFYNHPRDMKFPNHTRLQNWYKKLLNLGVDEGVVLNFSDLVGHAASQQVSSAKDMAYFDGDHWPVFFEGIITEEDIKQSTTEAAKYGPPPKKKSKKKKGGKYKKSQDENEYPQNLQVDSVMYRTVAEMYGRGDMFLVAKLNEPNPEKTIKDLDPLAASVILNARNELSSRDVLLTLLRRHNYEFSSLRNAKYSTLGLIYEINISNFVHCDRCGRKVGGDWFVCQTCPGYDLCLKCKEPSPEEELDISLHPHALILHSLKPKQVAPAPPTRLLLPIQENRPNPISQNSPGDHDQGDEGSLILEAMMHAPLCQCNVLEPKCTFAAELKGHVTTCTLPQTGCTVCSKLFNFAISHLSNCKNPSCPQPICTWWNANWRQNAF